MQFTRWCGVIVVSGLVACSGRSATYVEPQVPPHVGTALVHSPADPTVVLITEYAGALSLWRFADLRTPERLATVFTDAHLATFSADGKTIVVFGKDGKLRILDFDGKAIAESAETARGGTLPAGIAVDPDGQRVVTVGRDGVWSWSLPKLDRTSIEPNIHASAAAFSTRGALAI